MWVVVVVVTMMMMMARRSSSLISRMPWRLDLPLVLAGGIVLLVLGWTLPLVEMRTLIFWRDEFSIVRNAQAMWQDDEKRVAAMILIGASIIYPAVKAVMLVWFLVMPFPRVMRGRLLRVLRFTGRWAMVDVIVMAAIVLASMTIGPMDATAKPGLFAFAGGVLLLSVAAFLMERAAR